MAANPTKHLYNMLKTACMLVSAVLLMTACCNDDAIRQLQQESSEHAAELQEIKDASLVYVYVEYERILEDNAYIAGHFWDNTLSLEALLLLLALMLGFRTLVKRVRFLYKWFDGNPEIGLNTMCAVALSCSLLSMLPNPQDYWIIPTLIAITGIVFMVLSFYNTRLSEWLSNRWFKYMRRIYLIAFAVFVIICFVYKPELPIIEE